MTNTSTGRASRLENRTASATSTRPDPQRGMAIGFLAMLPLFIAYELGVARDGGVRNTAEVFLSLPLSPCGAHVDAARRGLLLACALWAGCTSFHSELGLLPRVWRVILEGALCAVVLGPLLILALHLLGIVDTTNALRTPVPSTVPRLAEAARLVGGAAYEEVLFRIGAQSLFYLLFGQVLHFLSAADRVARGGAEILSVLAAAVVFAAAHLAAFVAPLGAGGETFDAAIFTWRVLSGIMLSIIYRWRGPGVAAWTHGLFNLALFLGAGPDCFL
jgi:hypothetical protein